MGFPDQQKSWPVPLMLRISDESAANLYTFEMGYFFFPQPALNQVMDTMTTRPKGSPPQRNNICNHRQNELETWNGQSLSVQ